MSVSETAIRQPPTLAFRSTALSDKGAVRKLNEDSFVIRDDICLWAVADGAGGLAAGDVASRLMVEKLIEFEPEYGGRVFLEGLEDAIRAANRSILDYVGQTPGIDRMGTTIATLIAWRDYYACLWLGDSRVYLCRDGVLSQLTTDHSLVQELVDKGQIQPDEARHHPNRNVITRAVGVEPHIDIECRRAQILAGDRYLLCSDGLTGALDDERILEFLVDPSQARAAHGLMDAALKQGARDNVTFVLVDAVNVA